MTSSPNCTALLRGTYPSVMDGHFDNFTRRGFEPSGPRTGGAPEASALRRSERLLVDSARNTPRILLVDTTLALREVHLARLRSIPAVVEKLASCADLYLHPGIGYALVILVLHLRSAEIADVAHFVRHRWSASRILLVEGESAMIDDWLYDHRVNRDSLPVTVCEAAIRLMPDEDCRNPLLHRDNLEAGSQISKTPRRNSIVNRDIDPARAAHITREVLHVDDSAHAGRW